MKASSCRSSVAPPNTRMITSDCQLKAIKKRMSGKKSARSCITCHYTPYVPEPARGPPDHGSRSWRVLAAGGSETPEPWPVEGRAGIGLAAGRHVGMPGDMFDREAAPESLQEARELRILRRCVLCGVGPLELDADRK